MKKCLQFLYWATVLDFELVCLQLVRAIWEADFFIVQYCAKVMQTNFGEIPGFSWLFEEISLETIFG